MSERAYPPNCSECGYDLSGADVSKRPARCPECDEINPVFERDGRVYNWRQPSSLSVRLGRTKTMRDIAAFLGHREFRDTELDAPTAFGLVVGGVLLTLISCCCIAVVLDVIYGML